MATFFALLITALMIAFIVYFFVYNWGKF